MKYSYLDWAASAPPDPEIINESVGNSIKHYGNPSSIHTPGIEARKSLETARNRFAELLGCSTGEIIFTSGGSESNNMVLNSLYTRKGISSIIISGIEHPSVYEAAVQLKLSGHKIKILRADKDGTINPNQISGLIDKNTSMISIMTVNNETGSIQPINETAAKIREAEEKYGRKIHFHTDAVQALGKIDIRPILNAVDSASFSGHKIGGPRGIGALYIKRQLNFLYRGGGQEGDSRPGTENLSGIIGLVRAAEKQNIDFKTNLDHALMLKSLLYSRLKTIEGCRFIPENTGTDPLKYSPYILSAAFPPVPGEVLVRIMNDRGFAISTGSACSAGKKNRFRVMDNMQIEKDLSSSAVRISTGCKTAPEDIETFCTALKEELSVLRRVLKKRPLSYSL